MSLQWEKLHHAHHYWGQNIQEIKYNKEIKKGVGHSYVSAYQGSGRGFKTIH